MATLVLLAPQGAEYQAVRQGAARPPVAIAMGKAAVAQLDALQPNPPSSVILLGLAGGLGPTQQPGDVVVCDKWVTARGKQLACPMAAEVRRTLGAGGFATAGGTGLTSDRVICAAQEKQRLSQHYGTTIVDMEGYWVLARLKEMEIPAAVVRVVSDGADGDIPDISTAVGPDGALRPLALAKQMGRSPLAALRLIRGSMRGLAVLRQVAAKLS
ncbi:MAG: phosphorylase [Cyanobacteria bacterium P01_A01_bin.135]